MEITEKELGASEFRLVTPSVRGRDKIPKGDSVAI